MYSPLRATSLIVLVLVGFKKITNRGPSTLTNPSSSSPAGITLFVVWLHRLNHC